jgi:hypothetical protein
MKKVMFLSLVVILGLTITSWAEVSPPKPGGGIKVVPPSPAVPQELRKCSGAFSGRITSTKAPKGKSVSSLWEEVLLIVEDLKPNGQATLYVAWGDVQGPRALAKAGWERITGKFEIISEIPQLQVEDRKHKRWTFKFKADGTVFCKMDNLTASFTRWGDLERIKL